MAAGDYVLNLGSLTSLSMSDINGNDATPQARPGTITFAVDSFGYKVLTYARIFATVTQGALVSRWGGTSGSTAVTGITSGSTTTALKASAWTADTQAGAVFYVSDDAGAAGAAPEGEVSIVAANTSGQLTLDSDLPLSTAIAVNDAVRTISNWQAEASADGDLTGTVIGVLPGKNGCTSGNYAWVVSEGLVKAKTLVSVTVDTPAVADAGVIGPFGSDAPTLWIGSVKGVVASDNAALTVPVRLTCFSQVLIGAAS